MGVSFVQAACPRSRHSPSASHLPLVLCGYYWLTPAGSLPSFFPGYEAGGADHHHKHAIVALVVALVLFAFAWFQSKPARA